MKNVPEVYRKGQSWADENYITVMEVEKRFGVSRQQQRNLYAKGLPPDALYIGSTLCYWRASAEPYFRDYDARQKERITNSEIRKEKKKPGRPKKVKGEYEYTLWGSVYKTTNEPRAEMLNWKGYIAAQYPQFYEGGDFKKVIGELIKDQPPELKNALKEIDHVFRKIIAERAK